MVRMTPKHKQIRANAALTTSYVLCSAFDGGVISTDGYVQMVIDVGYISGAGGGSNTVQVRVTRSINNANYHQLTTSSIASGIDTRSPRVITLNASAAGASDYLSVSIPVSSGYYKVEIKETVAGGAAGSAFVDLTLESKS